MHKRALTKPDGRRLILYAREPLPESLAAPSPAAAPFASNPHLRWHPLRGEWVAYAGHRQHRTFLPPSADNPLSPSRNTAHPTEVPEGAWEVAVFEHLFPTFASTAPRIISVIVSNAALVTMPDGFGLADTGWTNVHPNLSAASKVAPKAERVPRNAWGISLSRW